MKIDPEVRVRMERAHVAAWPALETADVRGWLWRCSGGGSQRANSVSTVDFQGEDVVAAVAMVEALYRARGAVARFQTFAETRPNGLEAVLEDRGYRSGEATITMFRRPGAPFPAADVHMRDRAWNEWLDVYLGAITPDRRAMNQQILERIPAPRIFAAIQRDGRLVATALGVVAHGCAVIECVATCMDARRTGAARAVVGALLGWAEDMGVDTVGLQVASGNAAAIGLYQGLGFVAAVENRFWVQAGDGGMGAAGAA